MVKAVGKHETAPSIEQTAKIRKNSQDGQVSERVIDTIMHEKKPEKIRIVLKEDKLSKYFTSEFTPKQIEETILKLLEDWQKRRKRNREMER